LTLGADSPHVAMPLVAGMLQAHPGLSIDVRLGNTPQVWAALTEQRVDAAIIANPLLDDRMISVPLGRQEVVILVPARHPFARKRSVSTRELDGHPAVLREMESNTRKLADAILSDAGIAVKPVLTLNSREAVHEAVAAGLGIGFFLMREAGQDSRVRTLRIAGTQHRSEDHLVSFETQIGRRTIAALFKIARGLPSLAERNT
jgi:DNA-binding transcriptional LysR family regulator